MASCWTKFSLTKVSIFFDFFTIQQKRHPEFSSGYFSIESTFNALAEMQNQVQVDGAFLTIEISFDKHCPTMYWITAKSQKPTTNYSTVTDFAKLRGWSTLHPRITAIWYDNNCNGIVDSNGIKGSTVSGISIIWSANSFTIVSPLVTIAINFPFLDLIS